MKNEKEKGYFQINILYKKELTNPIYSKFHQNRRILIELCDAINIKISFNNSSVFFSNCSVFLSKLLNFGHQVKAIPLFHKKSAF